MQPLSEMKIITRFTLFVILNGVKNLNTSTSAFQILRVAQDDIGDVGYLVRY